MSLDHPVSQPTPTPTPIQPQPPTQPAPEAQACLEVPVWRWRSESAPDYAEGNDRLAEEVPLALLYDDTPYAVMLGTPRDLEDFACGFSLTEGVIERADQLLACRSVEQPEGVELHLTLAPGVAEAAAWRERSLAGRTGCGLCGVRALAAAVRWPRPLPDTLRLGAEQIDTALARLPEGQLLHAVTGSVHAAAWVLGSGAVFAVREDVGRHNALDKLLGAVLRAGLDVADGFALVSSRASYEMVQKAAQCGVQMLVAVSAPTAMARRVAQSCGLTLVAFARAGRHTVYTHPHRLRGGAAAGG